MRTITLSAGATQRDDSGDADGVDRRNGGCRRKPLPGAGAAGAGKAFCSGLDLSALQAMHDKTATEHRADAERIAKLFRTLYELPIPTIAAVHGAAIAGGTGLAMICDFIWRRRTRNSDSPRRGSALCPHWCRLFWSCKLETNEAGTCC